MSWLLSPKFFFKKKFSVVDLVLHHCAAEKGFIVFNRALHRAMKDHLRNYKPQEGGGPATRCHQAVDKGKVTASLMHFPHIVFPRTSLGALDSNGALKLDHLLFDTRPLPAARETQPRIPYPGLECDDTR